MTNVCVYEEALVDVVAAVNFEFNFEFLIFDDSGADHVGLRPRGDDRARFPGGGDIEAGVSNIVFDSISLNT